MDCTVHNDALTRALDVSELFVGISWGIALQKECILSKLMCIAFVRKTDIEL